MEEALSSLHHRLVRLEALYESRSGKGLGAQETSDNYDRVVQLLAQEICQGLRYNDNVNKGAYLDYDRFNVDYVLGVIRKHRETIRTHLKGLLARIKQILRNKIQDTAEFTAVYCDITDAFQHEGIHVHRRGKEFVIPEQESVRLPDYSRRSIFPR